MANSRSISFNWIPFDGEWIFDEPGRFGVVSDSSPASTQMSVLISTDLKLFDRDYDPEELQRLANRTESIQAGEPSPATS